MCVKNELDIKVWSVSLPGYSFTIIFDLSFDNVYRKSSFLDSFLTVSKKCGSQCQWGLTKPNDRAYQYTETKALDRR